MVKKILLALVVIVVVVVVGGWLYVSHLAKKLNSPEFQAQLKAEVSRALGTEVRFEEMEIALLSGVTLRDFAVANPAPFEGDLFTAEAFILRYKLRPLLSGRVEVEQLALETPVLGLIVDEEGRYNYEALGGEKKAPADQPAAEGERHEEGAEPSPAAAPAGEEPSGTSLEIVLSDVSVTSAFVSMVDDEDTNLMGIEDANFKSTFRLAGGVTEGRAQASIETISMADMLFIRDVKAPLEMSKEAVKLAPVEAKMAGGGATGGVTAHLQDGFRVEGSLDVDGVDMKTLLQEAQATPVMAGTLKAQTSFEGAGPLPTMKARGNAQIVDGRIEDSKILALLATVMKVPELATVEFEECLVEYSLANSVVSTPKVSLKSRSMQITGAGSVNLVHSTLDYDMKLALPESLLAKIPIQELRAAFKKRDDGLSEMEFKVFGSTEAPETDMLKQIGKAAAVDAAKGQAEKLLKKIF